MLRKSVTYTFFAFQTLVGFAEDYDCGNRILRNMSNKKAAHEVKEAEDKAAQAAKDAADKVKLEAKKAQMLAKYGKVQELVEAVWVVQPVEV